MIYEFWFKGISITCDKCVKTETYLHLLSHGSFVSMIDLSIFSVHFRDKYGDFVYFRLEKIEQHDEQEEFEKAMEQEDYLREVDEINSDGVHVVVNRDDLVSDEELEEMIQAEKNNYISSDDALSDIHNFSVCVDGENIICDTIHYWDSAMGDSYFDLIDNEFDTPGPFLYPDYSLEFVKILEGTAYYNLIHNDEPKLSDIHNFSVQLYDNEILCDNIRYWKSFIGTGYIEFVKDNIVIYTFMVCNYHLRFITILENTAYYNLVYKGA